MIFVNINYRLYLRYIIGISVVCALIYHVHSQEDIIPVLSQFDFSVLLPALMIIAMHLLCLLIMWKNIVCSIGEMRPGYLLLCHSFLGGRALGFITPGHTGELLKGMFFTSGVRLKGTSLSMIYAGYGMLVRTILGLIASIYFILKIQILYEINMKSLAIIFTIIFLSVIIVFLLLIKGRIMGHIERYFPAKILKLLCLFKSQLQSKSLSQFVYLLAMALAANLLAVLAFIVILFGFNIHVMNIQGFMAFEAAYFAMSLLPITPSGIGIREGSRIYFFSLIGCSQTAILCASVIMFGLNIMLPAILGIGSLKYFWQQESENP